jgi:hypothetical protein
MSVTRSETGAQHALGHPGALTHPGPMGHNGTLVGTTTLARPVTLGRPGTLRHPAPAARTESPPQKWSPRRTLLFVAVACCVLWALIIAAAIQLWFLLS